MEQKREKILIAEDDERLARLIIKKLETAQYEVYTSGNGSDALQEIRKLLPDLIILDVMMPGLSGFEVKEELSKHELTANIPVIFLTGKDELYDKVKGLSLGADDYITKPFKKEELLARVEAILRRKRYYEYIAMHDGLTGLFNLTYFTQQFTQFFNMAERYQNIFSLIIIDINKFKFINDTYGHQTGDMVLKEVAGVMQQSLRKSDILSRYGGDEFAIILPNTPTQMAEELGLRLVQEVAALAIPLNDGTPIHISLSFGCSAYEKKWKNKEEMFEATDSRMYNYKRSLTP